MSDDPRIKELIALHRMRPHPEGCYFVEVFRSENQVDPQDIFPVSIASAPMKYGVTWKVLLSDKSASLPILMK